jgi:hypothetical protein
VGNARVENSFKAHVDDLMNDEEGQSEKGE